ncbi:MAG: bifunctional DNA-binding transcriptional regulator/O6-methylguanine-DNA methyltransferase Ada [Planctomycetota bacterium]
MTTSKPSPIELDPRWAAVQNRDAQYDHDFVYAVRTTAVCCRPSCVARRPRPENVEFFADVTAAERAGYRACKRCRPDVAPAAGRDAALVIKLCRRLDAADHVPALAELAREAGLSPSRTQRLFKAAVGLTPKAYAAARRAERVRGRLLDGAAVTAAIQDAGYGSSGRFYAKATDLLGMTPAAYRAGGVAQRLEFAVGQCSLGAVLVAATARGVCAILLGEQPGPLVEDLQRRFPRAELVAGGAAFETRVATVVGLVEQPWSVAAHQPPPLPLDLRGTAFQHRVWRALAAIPPGQTATYAAVAAALGVPKAARAVAQACAANPLAVAIPCHRVVRRDGGLGGYRWGVAVKRELLRREER